MEMVGSSIKGVYRDVLKGADGCIIHDSGWVCNTILNGCRILLAGFMKNESSAGIQYLAVGRGSEAWDTAGVPAPDPVTTVGLVNPYLPPIQDLDLVYLDADDMTTQNPTSRLQIKATLKPGYPAPLSSLVPYPLREFGLFCCFGETDYMINSIRHPVIHKDESATLVRVIRLYF